MWCSNPHSMDRTASTLTIQPLRTLAVPAISHCFDLNHKFKVQQNNKTITGLNHTTNPDPNHNP